RTGSGGLFYSRAELGREKLEKWPNSCRISKAWKSRNTRKGRIVRGIHPPHFLNGVRSRCPTFGCETDPIARFERPAPPCDWLARGQAHGAEQDQRFVDRDRHRQWSAWFSPNHTYGAFYPMGKKRGQQPGEAAGPEDGSGGRG